MDQPIAIVGFMGCGKSAVARILATSLNRGMLDLDELIELQHRRSPSQIIQEDGEAVFRVIETITLEKLLQEGFSGVLALGGGAWVQPVNRDLLEANNTITVWLDVPFDVCWRRIESGEEVRPLAPTFAEARSLFDRRRETYALAHIHTRTMSEETVEDIASHVRSEIATYLSPSQQKLS